MRLQKKIRPSSPRRRVREEMPKQAVILGSPAQPRQYSKHPPVHIDDG
jgi:hypothetical protein